MKKRISGLLLVVCITLSMLPVAFASGSTIYVSSTGDDSNNGATAATAVKTIDRALALAEDGDTISISGTASSVRPENDLPLCITENVTITGGQLDLNHAGIILGANVAFDNITLSFNNTVRNVILANGYELTLNSVQQSETAQPIHLFCGGIGGYDGAEIPRAGDSGKIIISGDDNKLGDIFAGSFSEPISTLKEDSEDEYIVTPGGYCEWVKPSEIRISSGTDNSIGKVYSCGASEPRGEGNTGMTVHSENYPTSGGVNIYLSGSSPSVISGDTGAEGSATVHFEGDEGLISNIIFSDIGVLDVFSGKLQPAALPEDISMEVSAGALLDLSALSKDFTVGSFSGGGTLVLGSDQTLTIIGAVTGTTAVELSTAGDCITAENSTEGSFEIAGSFMELTRGDNGVWTAEWLSSPVTDFTVTGTTVSTAERTANLPVSVTYADEEGSWDTDFATIDFIVTVNDVSVEYDDSENAYVDSVTGLSFYPSTVEEAFIVEHGTAFSKGSYTIAITVPAENTTSGEAITRTATLTVTQATCSEHSGGKATCTAQATCGVCGAKYGDLDDGNHVSTTYTNGFRDCCGEYQPAVLNNGVYEISNAGQLYWFAAQVNGGNTAINGKLTADIVVNPGYTFNADGTVTYNGAAVTEGWSDWRPIGTSGSYKGTFDGQGHTVSGLYLNNSTTDYVGLFGVVSYGGTVQNVGVVNSYFSGKDFVGAIVGSNDGAVQNCFNTGTVTGTQDVGGVVGTNGSNGYICNCYNTGTVSGNDSYVGGVAGTNGGGNISNCYNIGTVSGNTNVGGVVGRAAGFIRNSYNIGTVVGWGNVGGVVGEYGGTIDSCYYLTGCAKDINGNAQNGIGNSNDEGVTACADFSTGEVAYRLRDFDENTGGGFPSGNWGQTIGTENYPVFDGDQVYYGYVSCAESAGKVYTNDSSASDTRPNHTGGTATCTTLAVCGNCGASYGEVDTTNHDSTVQCENGFCPNGCYEPAVLVDGVYEISNAGQLYWFAAQVNGGSANINAILTTDIVINQNVLVDGALNPDHASFRPWETTIGYRRVEVLSKPVSYVYPYNGIFDGNGHSISGLYYDKNGFDIALFGYIGEGGTVKDLTLKDTYIAGYMYLASLAAHNYGTISGCTTEGVVNVVNDSVAGIVYANHGTVVNCHNKATVNGSDDAYWLGGIAVKNFGTIDGCHNSGDVDGTGCRMVGGIAYINNEGGTIRNSHNSGTLTGSEGVGGIVSHNQRSTGNVSRGVIENCYNTGTINCTDSETAGGIASNNWGLMKNCFNFGEGASVLACDISDDDCEFVNCYYLSDSETDSFDATTAKTTDQFNSGEVAYLLGEAFGQTLGTDTHPVLGGAKVYYGYTTCNASQTDPIYTNDSSASADKPDHSYSDATCDAPKTCTECGATEGEKLNHIDEDTDHKCDHGCGKTEMGAHSDSDNDHDCDYGCETAIGTHADSATDTDHVCDYGCGVKMNDCTDATGDNNHTCDVCGAESITEHDWDDATCDAPKTCTECGATEGEKLGHIDEDTDHKCDHGCGKSDMGAHSDSDNDHDCDYGCETAIGEHSDSAADDDHLCDYGCDVKVNDCTDAIGDGDHTCDVCGAESITEHDWDDATCDTPKTCTECGATEGEKLEHAWTVTYTWSEDGKSCTATCVCGNDVSHNKTATATVTSEVTKAPTYTKKGETTYTATFAVDWAETQTKTLADIPVVKPKPEPAPIPTPIPTPEPEPEEKTVTVSVTDEENTVEVEVTVTESKATVEDVDLEKLEKVVDSDSSTVTIDFSELDEKIMEVELPVEIVEKIAEAAGKSKQTLKIVLSGGLSIEFNASQLNEQVQQTGGISLTVSIVPHEAAKLTHEQKTAVGDRPAYDISVTSGGKNISGMGGKITVTVPYELRNGEKGSGLVVYYVDDHGKCERCDTHYDTKTKRLSWQTDHLSLYMLDYDEKQVEACDGGEYCPINAFADTDSKAWYHNGVHYCIENDLMNGISDVLFAPNAITTRAQIVTILWRLEGKPVVNYLMQFEDVASERWYTEAVRWAASENIVSGYDNDKFGPNDPITREQMAAILYRYVQYKGGGFTGAWMFLLDYPDRAEVSEWAYEAMCWMTMNDIISGVADGDAVVLDPRGSATRAQAATILWRLYETNIDN